MNLIAKTLLASKEKGQFLSIYEYSDDDKFWFGKVVDFNEEIVVLQHYTKFGKQDGKLVLKRSYIKEINFDDDYERAMRYVIEHSCKIDEPKEIILNFNENNWQKSVLSQAKMTKDLIVSIEIENNRYSGIVLDIEDEHFILQCIGNNGEDEGKSMFRILDVERVSCDDKNDRRKFLLYEWRKIGLNEK